MRKFSCEVCICELEVIRAGSDNVGYGSLADMVFIGSDSDSQVLVTSAKLL